MKYLPILLLIFASAAVRAEVFKCTNASGKTVYQSDPCQGGEKGRQMDIKTDPKVEAEAKARLEALELEHEAEKAARSQADKEAAEQRNRAAEIDALNRNAAAQQQRAAAEQRQAEALERQNQLINRPVMILPGYLTPPTSGQHAHQPPPDQKTDAQDKNETGRTFRKDDRHW